MVKFKVKQMSQKEPRMMYLSPLHWSQGYEHPPCMQTPPVNLIKLDKSVKFKPTQKI